jgi:hypothetical protein
MPSGVRDAVSFMAWSQLFLHITNITPNDADPGLACLKSMQKRALICIVPLLNIYGRCTSDQDDADKFVLGKSRMNLL